MRAVALAAAVAVMAVTTMAAQAPARPNFSGTWITVSPADQAGGEKTIKHEGATLTERHDSEGGKHDVAFVIDGKSHDMPLSSPQVVSGKYTADWNGAKLVIDQTTDYASGFHRVSRQFWSLDDKGQLVIDLTSNLPDGSSLKATIVHKKR